MSEKPARGRRVLVLAVSVAGLIAAGAVAFYVNRDAAPGAAAAKPAAAVPPGGAFPTAVELARVSARTLVVDVAAVGSLRSNESVTLRPETAGRIARIDFRDGATVARGALLVALDDSMQAAELAQARANAALARSTFKRNEELFAKKFISSQALDSAAATLQVQEAAVALAEAKLAKTRVRAPFAGIVGIRNVSIGDYVKEGQDLINLEDIATLKVDFRLPESALTRLKVGQAIEVTSDVLPGQRFSATLDAIDPLVDANGRAVSCRARLDNAAGQLRPGMFVRTRIIFDNRENTLMVPEQAVVTDPVQPFVFAVVDGKAKRVPVRLGVRRDAQVEIVDGLKDGDVVVAAGQLKLRDGAPVRDVDQPPPGAAPAAKPEVKADAPARAAS